MTNPRTSERRAFERDYQRRRRAARIAAGTCVDCAAPRGKSKRWCDRHAAYHAQQLAAHWARKLAVAS